MCMCAPMCVYICTHTHSYVSWCPGFVDQLHGVNLKNSGPTLWRNNMPSLSGHLGEFAAGKWKRLHCWNEWI